MSRCLISPSFFYSFFVLFGIRLCRYWTQAFSDGMKAHGETPLLLPRASYAGSWRYGAGTNLTLPVWHGAALGLNIHLVSVASMSIIVHPSFFDLPLRCLV